MASLGLNTVNDMMARTLGRGKKEVVRWQDGTGAWLPISSDEMYGWVRAVADQLKEWGVGKGDRVVILSENRWEWQVTDFAALALGAVDAPLYATLGAEQIAYMVKDSGAKVAVVSNKEQLEKLAARGEFPDLQHVLVMDDLTSETPPQTKEPFEMRHPSFGDLKAAAKQKQARDAGFDALIGEAKPEQLCTIIYTSGTTGNPKGVELTHGNLASNVNLAVPQFGVTDKDVLISYLPLSHVFERHVDYALLTIGALVAYCPKFENLPAAMKAVRPTFFVGVPRVFEKIRQGVEGKSTGVKKTILNWALGVGAKHRQEVVDGKAPSGLSHTIANKLVFSKIHEAFGGRASKFVSGSAPLGMDSAGWFADVGIRILEGYGLTETSPVVSFNSPEANKLNTIGRALENVQVRFAPDGEMELKGPSIFHGYWQKPEETAKEFTRMGGSRRAISGRSMRKGTCRLRTGRRRF